MNSKDQDLVQLIAREVLAVLKQRQLQQAAQAAPSAGQPAPRSAEIAPPVGVCTGDYSKFPELAGKLYSAPAAGGNGHSAAAPAATPAAKPAKPAPAAVAAPAAPEPPAAQTPALSGIVTANQLQQAMQQAIDGVAVLAQDARLSPLANDLLRQFPQRVRRLSAAGPSAHADAAAALAGQPWLWWIDGHCSVVDQISAQHRQQLRPLTAGSRPSALGPIVREISAAVRGKRAPGAILFVHNAARAMCYVNRCLSLRGVVGTCGEALEQGIGDLGANVLVLEYPHLGPKAMEAMVQRMIGQLPKVPPAVERELNDLHRCG